MDSRQTLLSATALQKSFGALVVLDGIDFEIRSGDAIGIVGPNGAGKTTLLNVLSGAYKASAGSVRFREADVTELDAAQRCRLGIARTHQIPRPFSGMTVFENVLAAAMHGGRFGRDEAYERSIDAIRLCGMLKLANRRADTIGLLDRKRLELTRALATDPVVLLLDEIGGGLTDGE
ncbi:MAG: ATP-binding cassette domain-containing protein, partial [Burkholderiaceae bacterium]